jgi:phage-related protein
MKWKISFFDGKVEAETLRFPAGILANLLHILEMIEEFGPALGAPYTAPMGGGLFEIRARGKEGIGRSLFARLKAVRFLFFTLLSRRLRKHRRKICRLLEKD